MNHPAEVAIHSFLQKAMQGESRMSKAIINIVVKDVKDALSRQFSGEKRKFKLRMSNLSLIHI